MIERFDELRQAFPDTGFAIYAYEPGGEVTLEAIEGTKTHVMKGQTLGELLDTILEPPDEPPQLEPLDCLT